MRHAATTLSLCIALISGIVLALVWGQPPLRTSSIQAVTSSDVEATALAFYQAVNIYLDGGDDASLRQMLHPDFVNHDPGSSAGGNTATFMQQLGSIRAHFAGIQLTPDVEYLGNNAVSVSLSLSRQQKSNFAGIGIDAAEMIGRLDLLKIERRLIVERWSSASLAGELDAYPALSLELPFALNTLISRVQQLTLDASSGPTIDPLGHLLLIVQSGEARLDVMDSATIPVVQWRVEDGLVSGPDPVEPGMIVTLAQMDAVLLPAGTRFRLWDANARNTTLIALEFGPPVSGEDVQLSPHIVDELKETLWSGIALKSVGDRLILSFGRAGLLPQATLSSQDIEGLELTWVSGGAVELTASGGTARVRVASGLRSQPNEGRALLQTGDSGAAGPGADVSYRATGTSSATVWFFSIVPAGVEPSETDAGAPTALPTPPPPRTAS